MKRRAAAFVILLFSTIILFAQNSEVPQQLIPIDELRNRVDQLESLVKAMLDEKIS